MLGTAIGAASLAAVAITGGYQSMAPTGQWYGRTFTGVDRRSKLLALTFDDGPNDPYTQRLLEVLAKHQVQATFFLIGSYVQQRPEVVRELVRSGHIVGNHTFSHPSLIFRSAEEVRKEIEACRLALSEAVGEHSKLFRPPFGGRRPGVLRIARRLGLEPIMWNVTGYDWNAPTAEHIQRKLEKRVQGGDVILLHDGGHLAMGTDRSHTVTATDHLIARYKGAGYEFVTIPQMMASQSPVPMTAPPTSL